MANYCYTEIKIQDSAEKLDIIQHELEEALLEKPFSDRFDLPELLVHIGLSRTAAINGDIRCSGNIVDYHRTEREELQLYTQTKWVPNVVVIDRFVRSYSSTAKILYTADQYADDLFWSNDPDVVGKYHIDCYAEDFSSFPLKLQGFLCESSGNSGIVLMSEDEVASILHEAYGDGNIDELALKAMRDVEEPNWLSIHKYELVEIGEERWV